MSKLSSHLKVVSSDQRACAVVLKGTAPMTASHGTGEYRGIHGRLSITVMNGVVFPAKKTSGCVQNINKAVPADAGGWLRPGVVLTGRQMRHRPRAGQIRGVALRSRTG